MPLSDQRSFDDAQAVPLADERQALYRVFVLRLWRERHDQPWRASLQSDDGAVRRGFPSLEALITHLRTLVPHAEVRIANCEVVDPASASASNPSRRRHT